MRRGPKTYLRMAEPPKCWHMLNLVIDCRLAGEPIAKQLEKQNYQLPAERVELFQKVLDAIQLLQVHGFATGRQTGAAGFKLVKRIRSEIQLQRKQNESKTVL